MDRYPTEDDYEGPEDEFHPRDEPHGYIYGGWGDYEDYGDDFDLTDVEDFLDPYGDLE